MHPLLTRFLDASEALAVLDRGEAAATADPVGAAFLRAAQRLPEARAALSESRGRKQTPALAQEALLCLCVEGATDLVAADATLGPKVERAQAALRAEGATSDEARHLVTLAVAEEAFGFAHDPDLFDAAFLAETLDELVVLATLTEDVVGDLLQGFAAGGGPAVRPLRVTVAEHLIEAAWGEGPQPIGAEQLDDCLEALADAVAASEFDQAARELAEFIDFLGGARYVGPLRLQRLQHLARSAAAGGRGPLVGEEGEEGEEGEDDEAGQAN
jgi:hypothetical protein